MDKATINRLKAGCAHQLEINSIKPNTIKGVSFILAYWQGACGALNTKVEDVPEVYIKLMCGRAHELAIPEPLVQA